MISLWTLILPLSLQIICANLRTTYTLLVSTSQLYCSLVFFSSLENITGRHFSHETCSKHQAVQLCRLLNSSILPVSWVAYKWCSLTKRRVSSAYGSVLSKTAIGLDFLRCAISFCFCQTTAVPAALNVLLQLLVQTSNSNADTN